ncbi:DNA primase [Levilactobacillus humaensis]|uniref:DNA primase n=1 Tax=Levilactobacillus humaensis TaxID=2950375 RepID=UPI0021C28154|nr:DNA primase [Levilactobacillus humaensis]
MSLNFYAEIDSFKNDSKDNTSITLKAQGGSLDHSLDKLRELKNDSVVRIVVESAKVHYFETTDVETGASLVEYDQDEEGVWQAVTSDSTLDLDGVDTTVENQKDVTADVVDTFLLTQKYPLDPKAKFKPAQPLAMIAEGYGMDEVADKMKLTTSDLIVKLNQSREEFAPYAVAWKAQVEADDE